MVVTVAFIYPGSKDTVYQTQCGSLNRRILHSVIYLEREVTDISVIAYIEIIRILPSLRYLSLVQRQMANKLVRELHEIVGHCGEN